MSTAVVYKFPFSENHKTILLPASAQPLKVAMQHDKPTMWVMLDSDEPCVERHFELHGTGHVIPDSEKRTYIDTYFDGPFVIHVFEVTV